MGKKSNSSTHQGELAPAESDKRENKLKTLNKKPWTEE
jgi:hypothetical protein